MSEGWCCAWTARLEVVLNVAAFAMVVWEAVNDIRGCLTQEAYITVVNSSIDSIATVLHSWDV